jgi:integrase
MQQAAGAHFVTLRRVWGEYQQTRHLKPITVRNYEQRLNQYLGDWLDIPLSEITKDSVERRHREIPGKAMANSTMRTLRALLTYASYKYEDVDGQPLVKANPVRRLSEVGAWHRDRRRRTHVRPAQLRMWFKGVFSLTNTTIRDAILLAMFTGMRKSEILNLRWEDVDMQLGIIQLKNTKNGDSFDLPLSDYAWNLLKIRSIGAIGRWVFPGHVKDQPLKGLDSSVKMVAKASGVAFCLHDLRRSFITIGDELEVKSEVVKALVNHRSSDVTEAYTIRSIERLRRASQRITDYILQEAGLAQRRQG